MVRAPLLLATAAAAGVSAVAAALGTVPPPTRLGSQIEADIAARDSAAAKRKRALDLQEQATRATEQRLKAAAAATPPPQAQAPAGTPTTPIASEEDRLQSLARIYQAMKPKSAAPVFEQLNLDVQVQLVQRMKEKTSAAIIAAMSPAGAAKLSMAIARRPAVPLREAAGAGAAH